MNIEIIPYGRYPIKPKNNNYIYKKAYKVYSDYHIPLMSRAKPTENHHD